MPRRYLQVPDNVTFLGDQPGLPELMEVLRELVVNVNRSFSEIELVETELRGEEGFTVTFSGNIDLGGNRITNVGAPQRSTDVVTSETVQKQGLFSANPGRPMTTTQPIIAGGGMQITTSLGTSDAISQLDMEAFVAEQLEDNVATINDGEVVDREDLDGTVGGTAGTLLFGASFEDGELVARPVILRQGATLQHDARTHELLEQVLNSLETIAALLQKDS